MAASRLNRILRSIPFWYAVIILLMIGMYFQPVLVVVEVLGDHEQPLKISRTDSNGFVSTTEMKRVKNPWEESLYYSFRLDVDTDGEAFPELDPLKIHGSMFDPTTSSTITYHPVKNWKYRTGASQMVVYETGSRLKFDGYIDSGRNVLLIDGPETRWRLRLETPTGIRHLTSRYTVADGVERVPDQELALVLPPVRTTFYQAWVPRTSMGSLQVFFADAIPEIHHVAIGSMIQPAHFYATRAFPENQKGRIYLGQEFSIKDNVVSLQLIMASAC